MSDAIALHGDCAVCLAKNDGGETATAVLLAVVVYQGLESVLDDLCFFHRREHQDTVRGLERAHGAR